MRFRAIGAAALVSLVVLPAAGEARAADALITYRQALERAARLAPDLAIARSREAIAQAEVGIAGGPPTPPVTAGTSTQAAKLSAGVTVPLVILGQRGAAMDASRAELATTRVETESTAVDVRAGAAH